MTYGEVRDRVLMLLNQYSVAGGKIRVTYNNQADYLARVSGAVNDGLLYLATTARRLRQVQELTAAEEMPNVYVLPDDCWQLCAGGVFRMCGGEMERCGSFRMLGERQLLLPEADGGVWMAEYFRYPVPLRETPEDGDYVDCAPEAIGALTCYAAAQLAGADDVYLQSVLQNEFENRLSRLGEQPAAMRGTTEDVYGWGDMT